MIWYILISFFIALVLWVLLAPVIIFVNTDRNRYFLALPLVFRAEVVPSDEILNIKGWIFFVPYRFNPFRSKKGKEKGPVKEVRKRKKFRFYRGNAGMIADVIRSLRIRKLMLDIDTDDFVQNAWLVPVFSMINTDNIQMQVNFSGTMSLILDIRTRLGALLWVFTRNKIKSFF
jgi:hypothetical protein